MSKKIKNLLDMGFLDLTRLEYHRHFFKQELLMNRRFAPEIYKTMIPIFNSGINRVSLGMELVKKSNMP